MDWNNGGKTDWGDHAFFDSEMLKGDGCTSDDGADMGHLSWVLIGLIIFQVITWFAKIIY